MKKEETFELRVRDLISSNIVWLSVENSVVDAAIEMNKRDISSILLKSGDEFVGIITDRDIIGKIVAQDLNPKRVKLVDVMRSPLISINADDSIQKAAEKMRSNKIRRLVVKDKGHIIGIISESDIIRVEPELHFIIRERSRLGLSKPSPLEARRSSVSGICEDCKNFSEDIRNINGKWLCEVCRGR
ncbi:MAG: hypothetical protein QG670_611 [Thermoproteota archaeon]|nr:hypothetical protein [Thermoproteota archaeon]